MPIPVRNIFHDYFNPNGSPGTGTLILQLRRQSYMAGGTVGAGILTAPYINGRATITAWTNELLDDLRPTYYIWMTPDGEVGEVQVPAGDTDVSLDELRALGKPGPWTALQMEAALELIRVAIEADVDAAIASITTLVDTAVAAANAATAAANAATAATVGLAQRDSHDDARITALEALLRDQRLAAAGLGVSISFDEVSGTRYDDSVHEAYFEEVTAGAVTSQASTDYLGRRAIFPGTAGGYLTCSYSRGLEAFQGGENGAHTGFVRIRITDKTVQRGFWSNNGGVGLNGANLYYGVTNDRLEYSIVIGGTTYTVRANTLGSPAAGTGYSIVWRYDPDAGTLSIQVNEGAWDVLSSVPSGWAPRVDAAFELGRSHGTNLHNGTLDEFYWYNAALTDAEIAEVTNFNTWLTYSHDPAHSFWNLGTPTVTNALAGERENVSNRPTPPIVSTEFGGTRYDLTSYWNSAKYLVIGKRTGGPGNAWTWYTYDATGGNPMGAGDPLGPCGAGGPTGLPDGHHSSSLAVDSNGYIHLSFNNHASPHNYRKSTLPIDTFVGVFGAVQYMVSAVFEDQLTYPMFITDPAGALYFLYRRGISGLGDTYFLAYNAATGLWSPAPGGDANGKILAGVAVDQSPYPFRFPTFDPTFGSGGFMYLAWHWRTSDTGGVESNGDTNHDVSCMRWNGTTWTRVDGTAQTIPATPTNSPIIDPVSINSGMVSFSALLTDLNNRPRLFYWINDSNDVAQIYMTAWSGTAWVKTAISGFSGYSSTGDFQQRTISSPLAFVDGDTGEIYVFYKHTEDWNPGVMVLRSLSPYTSWTVEEVTTAAMGYGRPQFNQRLWEDEGVFELYLGLVKLIAPTSTANVPIWIGTWTP